MKTQTRLEFKKIREFGEVINDTFTFIKQNFKPLLKVYFYLCGFFVLATLITAIMQQIGIQKILKTSGSMQGMEIFRSMFSYQYLLVLIFSMANFTAINVSIFSFVALYVEKGNVAPTVEQVWGYFKYYYFRALISSIIISLLLLIGFVFCMIPFFYIFPAMSLFFPVMMIENGSFGYSFGRSFRLLKDQWWITAGTIIIIWVITYATTSFASLPGIILTVVSSLTSKSKEISTVVIIISTTIQYLCQVLLIIPVIGVSLSYFNLAERLDSTGLMSRIDQLGEKQEFQIDKEEY